MEDYINEVIKDVQKWEEKRSINERALVPTSEVLEDLKEYMILNEKEHEETLEKLESLKPLDVGNTYNTLHRITNDLDFEEYTFDELDFVVFRVHVGIDIRAGYTSEIILKGVSLFELFEFIQDRSHIKHYEKDGITYKIYVNAFHEDVEVWIENPDEDFTSYELDFEDIIEDVKKQRAT